MIRKNNITKVLVDNIPKKYINHSVNSDNNSQGSSGFSFHVVNDEDASVISFENLDLTELEDEQTEPPIVARLPKSGAMERQIRLGLPGSERSQSVELTTSVEPDAVQRGASCVTPENPEVSAGCHLFNEAGFHRIELKKNNAAGHLTIEALGKKIRALGSQHTQPIFVVYANYTKNTEKKAKGRLSAMEIQQLVELDQTLPDNLKIHGLDLGSSGLCNTNFCALSKMSNLRYLNVSGNNITTIGLHKAFHAKHADVPPFKSLRGLIFSGVITENLSEQSLKPTSGAENLEYVATNTAKSFMKKLFADNSNVKFVAPSEIDGGLKFRSGSPSLEA